MRSRFGRSQRTAQRSLLSVALVFTGCMAFQDVELSTERVSVANDSCELGKIYCNGKAPRVCVENDWVIQPECPQVCIPDHGCVDCRPGDTRCTDGKLETCNEQGHFAFTEDCAGNALKPFCDENLGCVECLLGDGRCQEGTITLHVCKGGQFVNTQTCSDSKAGCIKVNGQQDYCGRCDPGLTRCLEGEIKICGDKWLYEDTPIEECENGCNESTAMCNPPATTL